MTRRVKVPPDSGGGGGFGRAYRYVGPGEIRAQALEHPPTRCRVRGAAGLIGWLRSEDAGREVTLSFIIALDGTLIVADRRCEHVGIAAGEDVRSAGEITCEIDGDRLQLSGITNQSTGYCPDADSWLSVAEALEAAGIDHPGGFTQVFRFAVCNRCGQVNILKDGWGECGVCGVDLVGSG